MSIDGAYEVLFQTKGAPPDLIDVATQAFVVIRHGRIVGYDILGVTWRGLVIESVGSAITAEMEFDARDAQPDAVVLDGRGKRHRGPERMRIDLNALMDGDSVKLTARHRHGSIEYEAMLSRIARFDGPEI